MPNRVQWEPRKRAGKQVHPETILPALWNASLGRDWHGIEWKWAKCGQKGSWQGVEGTKPGLPPSIQAHKQAAASSKVLSLLCLGHATFTP